MPRNACSPKGTIAVVVSAAKTPEASTLRPRGRHSPSSRLTRFTAGADRGEVEPVGGADIAPQHLAQMQRRAEGQRRQALSGAFAVEVSHAGARRGDRTQRGVAGMEAGPLADREDRQYAVADEFSALRRRKAWTAPAIRSNQASSAATTDLGAVASDSSVKPRRSA